MKEFIRFNASNILQIILGSLCGDGHVGLARNGGNPTYTESHSLKQKEYLIWKNKFFDLVVNSKIDLNKNSKCKQIANRITLRTSYCDFWNYYHKLFYPIGKGNKIITKEILNMLNPLGLAVWFVDDGHYHYRSNKLRLSSHNLNHDNISDYFNKKYMFNLKSYKTTISFNRKDSDCFLKLIKNYILQMPKCVHYKIGIDKDKIMESQIKVYKYNLKRYYKYRIKL